MTSWSFEARSVPLLVVLSGPSGVGKDAVVSRMKKLDCPLEYVVTVTTRSRRAGERDHIDYHFISEADFQAMIKAGELLEWANVYGNFYGVPSGPIRAALEAGQDAIVKVDVQGAASIKKAAPEAIFVFLMPPSLDELVSRLKQRLTESPESLERRLKTAPEEITRIDMFDYVVVNYKGHLDQAVAQINAIITAEKCRLQPRHMKL